jgi:hypothetical protein
MMEKIPTIFKGEQIGNKQEEQIKENEEILNELLNIKDNKIIVEEVEEKIKKATGIANGEGIVTIKRKEIPPRNIFRIRKYPSTKNNEKMDIENLNFNGFNKEEYLWNPPTSIVLGGRFNKKGESLLYTSYSIETCVIETQIKEGDVFFLITYNMKKELTLCDLSDIDTIKENNSISRVNEIYAKLLTKNHSIANMVKEIFYGVGYLFDGWRCLSIPRCEDLEKNQYEKYILRLTGELENYNNLILLSEGIKDKLEIVDVKVMQRENNENILLYNGELINGNVKYHRVKEN